MTKEEYQEELIRDLETYMNEPKNYLKIKTMVMECHDYLLKTWDDIILFDLWAMYCVAIQLDMEWEQKLILQMIDRNQEQQERVRNLRKLRIFLQNCKDEEIPIVEQTMQEYLTKHTAESLKTLTS